MQCPDPATEKWLEGHAVPYEGQVVALADVSVELSHRNQARISQPVNEDTVLMYASAYANGETFPPPVLYRDTIGHLIVIDGNHRVAAMQLADRTHTDAYIVRDLGEAMIRILTFEANAKHGLPTSMDERIQQARYLMTLGITIAEAARLLRIPESKIQYAVDLDRAEARLRQVTGKATRITSGNAKRRLGAIRSDRVLAAATQLAEQAQLGAMEISDLVTRINREREEDGQMLVIQREISRRSARVAATAGGKVYMPTAVSVLEKVLAEIDRLDPAAIKVGLDSLGGGMKMILLSKVLDGERRLRDVYNA